MRHLNSGRKLSRNTSHRRALLRNLVTSFLDHGRLMTTLPKAKEIRPLAGIQLALPLLSALQQFDPPSIELPVHLRDKI